eukprot:tig00000681_g3121.t1
MISLLAQRLGAAPPVGGPRPGPSPRGGTTAATAAGGDNTAATAAAGQITLKRPPGPPRTIKAQNGDLAPPLDAADPLGVPVREPRDGVDRLLWVAPPLGADLAELRGRLHGDDQDGIRNKAASVRVRGCVLDPRRPAGDPTIDVREALLALRATDRLWNSEPRPGGRRGSALAPPEDPEDVAALARRYDRQE